MSAQTLPQHTINKNMTQDNPLDTIYIEIQIKWFPLEKRETPKSDIEHKAFCSPSVLLHSAVRTFTPSHLYGDAWVTPLSLI